MRIGAKEVRIVAGALGIVEHLPNGGTQYTFWKFGQKVLRWCQSGDVTWRVS